MFSAFPLIISILIIFPFLFDGVDFLDATRITPYQPKDGLPDSFFFTLVTQAFAASNINNNFFDAGAHLIYQPISFLPPSLFSKIADIPAQVSLWGIWMPFYKVSGPLIIIMAVIKNFKSGQSNKWWILPLGILMFYALAPINPKYILSLEFDKIIWLGSGYVLPGGNPPFSVTFILGGIIIYLFFSKQKKSLIDKILLVVLVALSINAKVAFYLPMGIFLGVYSFYRYFQHNEKTNLLLLLISVPLAILIYLYPFTSSGSAQFSLKPGYYLGWFMSNAGVQSILKGFIAMIVTLTLWGAIRWLILFIGIVKNRKEVLPVFVASFIAFFAALSLPSLLNLKLLSPNGEMLQDLTFDLVQFVRGAYLIFTFAALITIFIIWNNFVGKKYVVLSLMSFSLLLYFSNIYNGVNKTFQEENQSWRNEVRAELDNAEINNLLAIKGSRKYSGQLLAAEGYGPWWFTTKRGDGSGYIMSNKNFYRSQLVDSLFYGANPVKSLEIMKNEQVECFIATPDTKPKLDSIIQESHKYIYQPKGNKWLYFIK